MDFNIEKALPQFNVLSVTLYNNNNGYKIEPEIEIVGSYYENYKEELLDFITKYYKLSFKNNFELKWNEYTLLDRPFELLTYSNGEVKYRYVIRNSFDINTSDEIKDLFYVIKSEIDEKQLGLEDQSFYNQFKTVRLIIDGQTNSDLLQDFRKVQQLEQFPQLDFTEVEQSLMTSRFNFVGNNSMPLDYINVGKGLTDLFMSRGYKNEAKMLFGIDHYSIIKDNSIFKGLFDKVSEATKLTILNQSPIASIRFYKNGELLFQSSESKPVMDNNVLYGKDSLKLADNEKYMKFFQVKDKTLSNKMGGSYQYSTELQFIDGTWKYVTDVLKSAKDRRKVIETYKVVLLSGATGLDESFNAFIKPTTKWFADTYKELTTVKDPDYLEKTLNQMMDPKSEHVIDKTEEALRIFDILIYQLSQLLGVQSTDQGAGSTSPRYITIENTFKNAFKQLDYQDTGVDYLSVESNYDRDSGAFLDPTMKILREIKLPKLQEKVSNDLKMFFNYDGVLELQADNRKVKTTTRDSAYKYFTPSMISLDGIGTLFTFDMKTADSFVENSKSMLSGIYSYNKQKELGIEQPDCDKSLRFNKDNLIERMDQIFQLTGTTFRKVTRAAEETSGEDRNLNVPQDEPINIQSDENKKGFLNFMEELGFATLSNQIPSIDMFDLENENNILKMNHFNEEQIKDLPNSIKSLFAGNENITRFDFGTDEYLSSLNNLGFFWFNFFNLIKIEVLEGFKYSDDLGRLITSQPMWKPLESLGMSFTGRKLCRAKRYYYDQIGCRYIKELELPIYDEYFILVGN